MRLAPSALAALALCLSLSPARAQGSLAQEPIDGFLGVIDVMPQNVQSRPQAPNVPNAVTVAYDNTSSGANFAVSSTDLTADWGDRLFMTTSGVLSTHRFTIFNSGSSGGGPLLTAQVQVDFLDANTNANVGGYTVNLNFGAGLSTGVYALVNVTNLDPLVIQLPADVKVVQSVVSLTGTANRLGIASLEPVTVGASPTSMYVAAATLSGGAPGFYNFAAGPANPGYQVGFAQPPVGTASRTWGQLKRLYR